MKKRVLALSLLILNTSVFWGQLTFNILNKAHTTVYDKSNGLTFMAFEPGQNLKADQSIQILNELHHGNPKTSFLLVNQEEDRLGFMHLRYQVTYGGLPVNGALVFVHCKNGIITSLNGQLSPIQEPNNHLVLTETSALDKALIHLHVKRLKAENSQEEAHIRKVLHQPDFSFKPQGEKILYQTPEGFKLAWKVSFYAEEPLFNGSVFVDAENGTVLGQKSLICSVDVPAIANTKYSGNQNFTNDQFAGGYRLRESGRGLGIETYNLNNASNYGNATDFVNPSPTWTSTGVDQAATDAHWGAESTYDYFSLVHSRNSIDNNGFKLLSYVHYNSNYNNAFWDGLRMTYGDGNGSTFTILTGLDVCGHEITHGLVQKTAGLNGGGTGEADALNEAFADIFGTSIERYARPSNWNWKIGSDITPNGNGIRNMQSPNLLNDPDTYLGTFWDNAGEPHNNAGPAIFWFYLLNQGGSGTNDLNNAYNITGLGNVDAEKIAYRALTVYFTPGTTYNMARTYCIQAAKDLFGNCAMQVEQTANAWYAVGVGGPYSNAVIAPNFSAPVVSFCNLPATVNFNNTTSNAQSYIWQFGDGNTSNAINPTHTYTNNGTYSVKLIANGCSTLTDSIIKTAFITINAPNTPSVNGTSICYNSSAQLSANGNAYVQWYATPSATGTPLALGNSFVTPTLTANTSYYIVNSVTTAPVFGGILSNSSPGTAGGFLSNAAQWLIFDVLQPCTLKTVVMYAQAAGVRTLQILNGSSTSIYTQSVNLSAGSNTVTLGAILPIGNNYQLKLATGSVANLFRTNSGVSYPYNVGGCVNIKNSSAGTGFYYWFYNWEVQKENCNSGIVPVNVVVNPTPTVNLSVATLSVCPDNGLVQLTGSPAGGTFSGNGVNGTTFDPSIGSGNYQVQYAYTDTNGCKDSAQVNLFVAACTGLQELNKDQGIGIFPNPFTTSLVVENTNGLKLEMKLYDAIGRLVYESAITETRFTANLNTLSKGIYIIEILHNNEQIRYSKLVKE